MPSEDLLAYTGAIVATHVANNTVSVGDLPNLIKSVHDALAGLGAPPQQPVEEFVGAVTARKSLSRTDVIVSMIDGKSYKMLKRHLSQNGLTPAQYRERYKLPADYPMVAPDYSATRQALAKKIGLGRKRAPEPVPVKAPRRRAPKAAPPEA